MMTEKNINTQKTYNYLIKQDIDQDAWNWYVTCNNINISHGIDFSKNISEDIYKNINGKTKSDAYTNIIPYLKQKYITDKKKIDGYTDQVKEIYENTFNDACKKIANLTSKSLYRNDFTTFLTTAPRAPYKYNDGQTWLPIGWLDPIRIFMHELLHFQFIHYWRLNTDSAVNKLSDKEFEYLKESLTIILDEELKPLIQSPDKGYPMHQEFRKELHKFWATNKNFDELVNFGLKILPDFIEL